MKNLKKVLALVMAFAMAFTMFAGAVDFDDVKPGDDYSAAISMLSDLDVISGNGKGSYEPNKTITRAEACVLMANIMNGGKADTARFAGGSNFSDVAHGWWGESAIAYCVQNGITYGVGGGKFAPNREITDAEFVAMLTRAMGYDTAANPLSFPYGNYTAAVNNGLLDNVPYAEGSDCTKGEAAQMLYDALFADYARMTANLNVVHGADDHDTCTLIEDVFGLVRASNESENSKCTSHYWVIDDADVCDEEDTIAAYRVTDKGEVKAIEEFECAVDVSTLVGYKVVLWGDESHAGSAEWNIDTVKAVEIVEGQTAYDFVPTMDLEDDLDLKAASKTYGYEGKITDKNGNSYVLIDWDNNDKYDYVVATIREYYEVKSVTAKVVKFEGGLELDLDGETKIDGHKVVCEIPEDIAKGDIVEIVYTDCGYEETIEVAMSIVEPETMEVTEVASKGHKVYFDDEHLVVADKYFDDAEDKYDAIDDSDDEYTWDVWQDANGYILKLAEPSESYAGYLLVLGQDDGSVLTGERHLAELDVYYEDNTSAEDVKVAKDASITMSIDFDDDGDLDEVNAYDEDTRAFEAMLVGSAFKYKMEDGEITKLVQVAYNWTDYFAYDSESEMMFIDGERAWMDDVDVVFAVKFEAEEDMGGMYQFRPNYDPTDVQIKAKNVKAVEYTELPDINYDDTYGYALGYTKAADTKMSLNKAAVVYIDTFKYFDDITTNAALVTDVTYKTSTDKWTVKAIVAGEGLTTFTAKEGALDEGTVENLNLLQKDLDSLKMVWAEIEFTDGVLSDIAPMENDDHYVDEFTYDEDLVVTRIALNHYTAASDKVSVAKLVQSNDGKVVPAASTDVFATLKITDATEFFAIDEDDDDESLPVFPGAEGEKLATFNGYGVDSVSEISFSTALNSYLDDDNWDEGEYQVADVLVNEDDEIVMIFFFQDLVEAEEWTAPANKLGMKAFTNLEGYVGVELFEGVYNRETGEYDYSEISEAALAAVADAKFTVTAKREATSGATVGGTNVMEDVELTFDADKVVLITGHADKGYMALIHADGIASDMEVTVSVAGYGEVTIEVGDLTSGNEFIASSF